MYTNPAWPSGDTVEKYQKTRIRAERPQESVVSGALALLLRISTVAGVCPLRFKRARDGWLPLVSAPLAAVQRVVFTVFSALALLLRLDWRRRPGVCPLRFECARGGCTPSKPRPSLSYNVVMLAGFVLDFCQAPEDRIRVGETTLKAFVWISDLFLMMTIASIAVYTGPSRMENIIQLLTQIQQVNTELKMRPSARNEKIKSILIICIILWAISILIADFYSFLMPLQDNQMSYIMCMYCGYYVGNLLAVLVLLQWCCAVLAVHDAVVAVNEELARLRTANFEVEPIATLEDLLRSPNFGRNTLVDCFTKHGKVNSGAKPPTSISLAQTAIRRLALSQERISELTRQLNATNGIFLTFVLMSTFLRLVLTPYYLLLRFDHDVKVLYETLLQLNWSLFHVVTLLMTIEPCHWTQEQRERTQILLGQLIVHLAPKCEVLSRELDQFAKQILLGNPKYMPLGVYPLARPLMATILGGVTTYLVIIIQFQKISDQL